MPISCALQPATIKKVLNKQGQRSGARMMQADLIPTSASAVLYIYLLATFIIDCTFDKLLYSELLWHSQLVNQQKHCHHLSESSHSYILSILNYNSDNNSASFLSFPIIGCFR